MEVFRDTSYTIDTDGKVFNKKGKQLAYSVYGGYLRVQLWLNGKNEGFYVHRMVAETFLPNPDKLPVVNHKDSDKLNPKLVNLEWTTPSGNAKHAYDAGNIKHLYRESGEKHYLAKSDKLMKEVLDLYATGNYTYTQLGKIYNIHPSTIGKWKNGINRGK